MPEVRIDDGLTLHYERDCFAAPWRRPETILLVHGLGGCAGEWFAWVPPLAADHDVLRVDLRGWGKSTVPPADYPWSMANFAADLAALLDRLGIDRVHYVGCKLGGRIGLHFARNHPDRLHSLTLVSTPVTLRGDPADSRDRRPTVAGGAGSVAEWARRTMPARLGQVPAAQFEWWVDLYSASDPQVISGIFDVAWATDEHDLLSHVTVPTLVIDNPGLRDLGPHAGIGDVRIVEIPVTTEGRMLSASMPGACVAALRAFLADLPQDAKSTADSASEIASNIA